MKHTERKQTESRWPILVTAVLVVVLIGLTWATLALIRNSASFRDTVPFDLDRITADKTAEVTDVSGVLLPEFIGITSDGVRRGVSVSANTVAELYAYLMPVLGACLRDEYAAIGDARTWEACASAADSVYVRYHTALSDHVLAVCADADAASENSAHTAVQELFVMPYSALTDTITVVTRAPDGTILFFRRTAPEELFTADDLSKLRRAYRSSLAGFVFAETGEPLFRESIVTRTILVTAETATLVQNRQEEVESLLRLFALNPDKLLNSHIAEDGTGSYIDPKGILALTTDAFLYTASADGGVPLEDLPGHTGDGTVLDYIRASVRLFSDVRALSRHYTGGDADLLLSDVVSSDGTVTLTFAYTFDNIRLYDTPPAFTVVFRDGVLVSAQLSTIAVRNLGVREESFAEWWFVEHISDKYDRTVRNAALGYRSDYLAESVSAEWIAAWEVDA